MRPDAADDAATQQEYRQQQDARDLTRALYERQGARRPRGKARDAEERAARALVEHFGGLDGAQCYLSERLHHRTITQTLSMRWALDDAANFSQPVVPTSSDVSGPETAGVSETEPPEGTPPTLRDRWGEARKELADTITPGNYRAWIKPLVLTALNGASATVRAPTEQIADYAQKRLGDRLASALGVATVMVETADSHRPDGLADPGIRLVKSE